ncbi:unnamed protein product, partial [marine sediment metagenome]
GGISNSELRKAFMIVYGAVIKKKYEKSSKVIVSS